MSGTEILFERDIGVEFGKSRETGPRFSQTQKSEE